ncbi:MAG: hypothetical protein JWN84_2709 [Nocardioides sp.]|nr:hypothetical protein [Nocardioides sp.]
MTTRRGTAVLAGLALTTTLALAGCSDDDGDPESWYRDYDSQESDSGGTVFESATSAGGSEALPAPGRPGPLSPGVPAPDEDNTFVDPGRNGFVETAADPRSTFGLDVDTGSLGVARALLADGYDVPAASVRPEEWVNALPYADPAPTGTDLGLVAETGPAPTLDDGTQVVRIGVSAREVDPAQRPRVNVTLVVDRSGSMDVRDRLGLVQSSLALLAERLEDDDTVSVVSFDDQAAPILEPTPVSDTDAILGAVAELTPGGGTNLEGGLRLGYEQARRAFDPEAVNLVVLCSDGVANVGATGPGSITRRIAEAGADGIHLVTVGFGMGNYNDHLMEQLADLGDGFYSYVDDFAEAEQLFGTDLTTTLVPVAAEARAQVAFDPTLVTAYRLIGYENRDIADEEFTDLGVDAGELGAGHHATALYEVTLADDVEPGSRIGTASLLWRPTGPGSEESEPREAQVDLLAAEADAVPSTDWGLATAAADLAQLLEGDASWLERGVTLDDLAARVAELDGVPGAAELADLVEMARR